MSGNFEAEFSTRFEKFFNLIKIDLKLINRTGFIEFGISEFNKQNTLREDGSFRLKARFLMDTLKKYLKMKPQQEIDLFSDSRLKRDKVNYKSLDLEVKKITRS